MKETLENAIYKNMAKLLIGDGIARILGFVITPVLTRIYLPAEMGSLAVFTSFVAILIPFSTLRYPLLIPVLKDEKMAFSLSYATFLMLLCSTILLIISLFFFKSDIFSLFSVEELSDFWWLIPISFFSMGLYELFYQWAIRKKEFLLLSKSKILQKSIGSAVQIGLGMASFGSLGLIIGSIFSEAGGLSLFARSFKKDICCNYRFVRWSRMKVILGKFVNYPVYRLPAQFLLSLSGKMPLLYFAWKSGAGMAGQVGLATTMLSIPITLLGSSVGKAFYAEVSGMGSSKRIEILYLTRNTKTILYKLNPYYPDSSFCSHTVRAVFWNGLGASRCFCPYSGYLFNYSICLQSYQRGIVQYSEKAVYRIMSKNNSHFNYQYGFWSVLLLGIFSYCDSFTL